MQRPGHPRGTWRVVILLLALVACGREQSRPAAIDVVDDRTRESAAPGEADVSVGPPQSERGRAQDRPRVLPRRRHVDRTSGDQGVPARALSPEEREREQIVRAYSRPAVATVAPFNPHAARVTFTDTAPPGIDTPHSLRVRVIDQGDAGVPDVQVSLHPSGTRSREVTTRVWGLADEVQVASGRYDFLIDGVPPGYWGGVVRDGIPERSPGFCVYLDDEEPHLLVELRILRSDTDITLRLDPLPEHLPAYPRTGVTIPFSDGSVRRVSGWSRVEKGRFRLWALAPATVDVLVALPDGSCGSRRLTARDRADGTTLHLARGPLTVRFEIPARVRDPELEIRLLQLLERPGVAALHHVRFSRRSPGAISEATIDGVRAGRYAAIHRVKPGVSVGTIVEIGAERDVISLDALPRTVATGGADVVVHHDDSAPRSGFGGDNPWLLVASADARPTAWHRLLFDLDDVRLPPGRYRVLTGFSFGTHIPGGANYRERTLEVPIGGAEWKLREFDVYELPARR